MGFKGHSVFGSTNVGRLPRQLYCLSVTVFTVPSVLISRRYNLTSQLWLTLNRSVDAVTARYGHSLALHEVGLPQRSARAP